MSYKFTQVMENNSSPFIKKLRITLLVLIIVGMVLLCTENIWLQKLTDYLVTTLAKQ